MMPQAANHEKTSAHALSVLVVDDDYTSRDALVRAVRGLGYASAVAHDGVEALEMIARRRFDVVMSSGKMPHMGGPDLCRAVRDREHDYTYFVLVTGQVDRAQMIEEMRAGADDWLTKPVDPAAVEVRLLAARRVIDTHQKLRARNRELRRDSQRNFQLARYDALTGIRNRLALAEDMVAARENLNRYGSRCAVAMCDIDHFKAYNDAFGHVRGDAALRQIASVMQRALRAGDRLYRYGGEEFVVLLREQTVEGALLATERIRCAVEAQTIRHADGIGTPFVTISVGVSELTTKDDDQAVIRRADAALYRAKSGGRNRVEG